MQTCSKCQSLSPDSAVECVSCRAALSEWSTVAVALQRHRANPRVSYIRIQANDDCCPACRETRGAYAKDAVPKLPVEGCSHNLGCRCFYEPFLNEIYP